MSWSPTGFEGNEAWFQERAVMFDQLTVLFEQGYGGAGQWREHGCDVFGFC